MLGLKLPTDPRWTNLAEKELSEILTDHAYCELKASTTCISLIQVHPNRQLLVDKLTPIVAEEWSHFQAVKAEIEKRGLKLGFQRKDEYVQELIKFKLKGNSKEVQLVEKLLMAGLIEARSCERFRLLSLELKDEQLRKFYHKFMVAEAGHFRLFLDLAEHYGGKDYVKTRWQEWLNFEAELLKGMELKGDRMH